MRFITNHLLCIGLVLGATIAAHGQTTVPLPNGKKLELKRSPAPEMPPFPEIKPPQKSGTTTGRGASSGAIKERVLEMEKETFPMSQLRFLSDGKTLLSAGDQMTAWDLTTGKTKFVIEIPRRLDRVFDVAADEQSFYLLESELVKDQFVSLLRQRDITTGKPLRGLRLSEEKGTLFWLATAGGGKTVLTGIVLDGPTIVTRLCDLSTGKTLKEIASTKVTDPRAETPIYAAPAIALLATRVIDTSKDEIVAIRLYDATTAALHKEISLNQNGEKGAIPVLGVEISRDGKMLALAPPFFAKTVIGKEIHSGKVVRIFDTSTGALKNSFSVRGEKVSIISLAFSPQGDKLALAGVANAKEAEIGKRIPGTGTLVVHDVATGKEIKSWRVEGESIIGVAFSPDGSMLAASGVRYGKNESDDVGVVHILRLSDPPVSGGSKEPVVKTGPLPPEVVADLQRLAAQFALKAGDGKEAVSHYQKALKDDPNNAALHLGLGQALAKQNLFPEATAALRGAIERDPKNPAPRQALADVLTNHAKELMHKERWAEAAQRVHEALALHPRNAEPHLMLAKSLLQQGEIEDAAKHLHAAQLKGLHDAALAGKIAQRLTELGMQARAKKDLEMHVAHFQLAATIDSHNASHHASLGSALLGVNRLKEAVAAIEKAMRLEPTRIEHKQAYAGVLQQLGRWRDAETALRSLLLNHPDDKHAQAALAECVLRQSRPAEAKQFADRALKNGLPHADLPEVVRSFLDADKAGKPFEVPGVPSVVGLSAAEAKKALAAAGITVKYQLGAAAPSARQVNTTYAMEPEAGSPLVKDAVVTMTLYGPVSAVANLATIPDLSGLPAKSVKELLDKEGLTAKFQLGRAAPTKTQALMAYQTEPAAGARVAKASEVTVFLYGPPDETPGAAGTVPNLAGFGAQKAKSILEAAGFKARFVLGRPAPLKEQSLQVYQTEPAAGSRAAPGSEIVVTLYAANDTKNTDPSEPKDAVAVPDCLTLSLAEATAKLKAAGFAVSSKVGRPAIFADQIERVYQMEPPAGTRVERGTTIQLLVYGNRKEGP